jgi:SPP1 gp7 family putative phage head morphogenesis protein
VFHELYAYARQLLHGSAFERLVRTSARLTARSVRDQTANALALPDHDPDLDKPIDAYTDDVMDGMQDLLGDSVQRGADVLDEWADLDPARSERAGDLDALDDMLDDGLDGIGGRALQAAALVFGSAFADMVKLSQLDAGVSSYMWHSQLDSHVRPEHAQLDGEIAKWDEPPLKASDSDNGEDDHPGEDYGCRCTAAPMDPTEEES